MLTLEGLLLRQGSFVLRADLQIAPRSKVAVIGPSGAGKSTLINAIGGYIRPEEGRITWQSRDLTPLPPAARPVSVLFQDNNLFPHLNVMQNVALGLKPSLRLTAQEAEQVTAALEQTGLADHATSKPGQLSGGQQSRAALARMLVRAKPLVLLDEPFAALGPALKDEMLDLVADLVDRTGATLMMVTHSPQDARQIAGLVVVVADGRAEPPVATQWLMDNPPPSIRAYLGG
jgi:thiamine transport system ATP-binding protein